MGKFICLESVKNYKYPATVYVVYLCTCYQVTLSGNVNTPFKKYYIYSEMQRVMSLDVYIYMHLSFFIITVQERLCNSVEVLW